MEIDIARQLKIKIGALKRIHKEYAGYQKEEEKQREKIKTLEITNVDEYTIKKQVLKLNKPLPPQRNFTKISLERSLGGNSGNAAQR
jgi:hypothetical protein